MRIINQLRKLYPGKWKHEYTPAGTSRWIGPNFIVGAFSMHAPVYDAEERFMTVYLRLDTQRPVGIEPSKPYWC